MDGKWRKWVAGTTLAASVFTSATVSAFGQQKVHYVSKGDSLWKIAQQYNMTLEELYRLNPQYKTNSVIYVGEKILIAPSERNLQHVVVKGDTPWKISQFYQVPLDEVLKANNLKARDEIYPGQILIIPSKKDIAGWEYTVEKNDTPWVISQKFQVSLENFLRVNQLKAGDYIYEGQKVIIPTDAAHSSNSSSSSNTSSNSSNSKSYITHTVVQGDDLWKISIQYGIPFKELLEVNGLKENHLLTIGEKLTIPVYHIAVKPTPGPQYGELLDWWSEAQYVVPIGKVFNVVDFYTGKRWRMKRTIGANHADCEPLTKNDAAIMKEVWGGSYSWAARPVIIEVDNRRIAASASSMPHDIQYIKDNGFNGHADIHFYNSTRHVDGKPDLRHQENVKIAAGYN